MRLNYLLLGMLSLSVLFSSCQQSESKCCSKDISKETVSMEITSFDTIKLQAPDTLGGVQLMKAMKNRQTNREFKSDNLSLKHLSEILWATNGINRDNGKRTVPSALALYPLQTYAVLANGIYFYNVEKHQLEPVVEGDFREMCGYQEFVNTAPLNILLIADYKAYTGDRKVPQDKWLYLASLDAGHCTQNIYLYCASEGLHTVVRAGAKEEELKKVLNLGDDYQFIVAQTVGY